MTTLYNLFLASSGVSTDSRTTAQGAMFFALHGDRFDGNRYAANALDRGAAWAVVDDPRVAVDERYLVVADTLLALQRLAAHHRQRLGIPILAITGTNGKTTTKELTGRVLSRKFGVSVTQGNLNNHIGVPLTLLAMDDRTQFGIVEMGAGAVGEIRTLCDIAAPDYGLITNVGRAHLEGFGGFDGVKRGKGELYDYLAAHGGTAFVRREDGDLVEMAATRPEMKTVCYSSDDAAGMRHRLEGDYNDANIAAAVAVGRYFEVAPAEIAAAVEGYTPDNHRSQRTDTERNALILDCYNANPSSMRAAIDNFARLDDQRPKSVILGDMLELGAFSATEHEAVLRLLDEKGLRDVYLVGGYFSQAVRDYPAGSDMTLRTFGDVASLVEYLAANPVSGHIILVKGSRGIALEKAKPAL